MTNGEKMQAVFPDIEMWGESKDTLDYSLGGMIHRVTKSFWNAEYKEPITKNDLGVDAVSRQSVLDLIADYDLSMGQVVRGIHALPSVTPQEPKWIPVSERLPDTDNEVLCWYEYYHWSRKKILPEYGLGSYFKETESWFGEVANGHKVRVIAWMPLPEPYKIESEE